MTGVVRLAPEGQDDARDDRADDDVRSVDESVTVEASTASQLISVRTLNMVLLGVRGQVGR
jgi:hypothetical protein